MFPFLLYFHYYLFLYRSHAVNLFLYGKRKLYVRYELDFLSSVEKFHNLFNKISHWRIFNPTTILRVRSSLELTWNPRFIIRNQEIRPTGAENLTLFAKLSESADAAFKEGISDGAGVARTSGGESAREKERGRERESDGPLTAGFLR